MTAQRESIYNVYIAPCQDTHHLQVERRQRSLPAKDRRSAAVHHTEPFTEVIFFAFDTVVLHNISLSFFINVRGCTQHIPLPVPNQDKLGVLWHEGHLV